MRERERERGTNGQIADALLKNQDMDYYTWVMLTSVFRVLVNNPLYESFDTTFMENKKNCQNINIFFLFSIKFSLNKLLINVLRTLVNISHYVFRSSALNCLVNKELNKKF